MSETLLAPPLAADCYLTGKCNLHCHFCYYRQGGRAPAADLDTAIWLDILAELAVFPVLQVLIPGGEPLLRRDILTLLQKIVDCRMRLVLNTNGTLLTEEHAEFLSGCHRTDYVQISVDGTELQHDAIRGAGRYQQALSAIRKLQKYGVPVIVNMVATPENYRDCPDACAQLLEEFDLFHLQLNAVTDSFEVAPSGAGRLTEAQLAELLPRLLRLKSRYSNFRSGILRLYNEIRHPHGTDAACKHCGALTRKIAIRSDGEVIPCVSGVNIPAGPYRPGKLLETWRNSPVLAKMRAAAVAGRQLTSPECRDCEYAFYCRQLCPAAAHQAHVCRRHLKQLFEAAL